MTERSKRRSAEMAVINAAVRWKTAYFRQMLSGERPNVSHEGEYELAKAVGALEALGLATPDKAPVNSDAPQTAHDAATYMRDKAGIVARDVYDCIVLAIVQRGDIGMTSDEVERRLKRPHQSVSARINQLRDLGYLVDTGERRRTGVEHKGRPAIVWAPSALAWEAEHELRSF
jgi:hypothetical protein